MPISNPIINDCRNFINLYNDGSDSIKSPGGLYILIKDTGTKIKELKTFYIELKNNNLKNSPQEIINQQNEIVFMLIKLYVILTDLNIKMYLQNKDPAYKKGFLDAANNSNKISLELLYAKGGPFYSGMSEEALDKLKEKSAQFWLFIYQQLLPARDRLKHQGRNIEEIYNQFQKSVKAASGEKVKQFHLLADHASQCWLKAKESTDPNFRKNWFLKIAEIYNLAALIWAHLENSPNALDLKARTILMCSELCSLIKEHLKDHNFYGEKYYQNSQDFFNNFKRFLDIGKRLFPYCLSSNRFSPLEIEYEKLITHWNENQKKEEIKRQELLNYDNKLPQLLSEFPSKPKEIKKPDFNYIRRFYPDKKEKMSDGANKVTQDENIHLHIVTIEEIEGNSDVLSQKKQFANLPKLLKFLEDAQKKKNDLAIIKANYNMGDYYRLEAERCMKNYNMEQFSEMIKCCEESDRYFTAMFTSINEVMELPITIKNWEELNDIRCWTNIILDSLNTQVKKIIQNCAGRYVEKTKLSARSKERIAIEQQLPKLRQLESRLEEHHEQGEQQFSKLKCLQRKNDRLLAIKNQLDQRDFVETRTVTREYWRHNFFVPPAKKSLLQRSLSSESFFEPADFAMRKQSGYNRGRF